jgi:hypothetical protein
MVFGKVVDKQSDSLNTGLAFSIVLLAVGLYYMDLRLLWNGYPIKVLQNSRVWLNAARLFLPFIIFGLLYLYKKSMDRQEIISKWALEFLWILIGVVSFPDLMSMIHLAFSVSAYYMLKRAASDDLASFSWMIFGLTFVDFFGFAAIKGMLNIAPLGLTAIQFSRLYIPLWIYFSLIFAQGHNGAPLFSYLFIFLFLMNLIMAFNGMTMIRNRTDTLPRSVAKQWWEDFSGGWQVLTRDMWNQAFNTSYIYGGGTEPSENPQGVFLKEMDRGERTLRPGNPIHLWVKLEARTLDKPFQVVLSCKTEIENDIGAYEIHGIVDEENNAETITIDVLSGVERHIQCYFESLPEGSYDVVFTAEYDFSADADLRVFLMDRDRLIDDLQVLVDKGRQPTGKTVLSELYGVTDIEPESISSTGPVLLAIATDNPPWDLGDTNNLRPFFGISVVNNWERGGHIKQIDKIYFKLPDDFSIYDPSRSCDSVVVLSSSGQEPGYKVYETAESFDEITEESRTVNCNMNINRAGLDPIPVTTRFLKAHVDYTYILEEKIGIEVEGFGVMSEQEEMIQKNQICCSTKTKGSTTKATYTWSDEEICRKLGDDSPEIISSVVEPINCESEFCCRIDSYSGYAYTWVDSQDKCKPDNYVSRKILDPEYNYLCEE